MRSALKYTMYNYFTRVIDLLIERLMFCRRPFGNRCVQNHPKPG